MKKYLFAFAACYLLLSCRHEHQDESIEDPYEIPCGCTDEWSDEAPICRNDMVWDYPVKPGTEEWEQLQTVKERIDICQIPENLLSSLSTDDLTGISMQYPLMSFDLFFYRPHDNGLDTLIKKFNGVRELLLREDASKSLLKWYDCAIQNLSFLHGDASVSTKGDYILKIAAASLLLSRCLLQDDANKEHCMEIVQHLVCGYEKMVIDYTEFFGYFSNSMSYAANCYTRIKIIIKIDEHSLVKIPQGFSNILFINAELDDQTRCSVDELSCQFIN